MRRALVSKLLLHVGERQRSAAARPGRASAATRAEHAFEAGAVAARGEPRSGSPAASRDSSRASRSGGAVKITVSLIGEGFGGFAGGAAPARCGAADGSSRSSARRRRARWCAARASPGVAAASLELLLELLLVEQLPAGDAVDLRAQFGDAVLVGESASRAWRAIRRVARRRGTRNRCRWRSTRPP